MTRPAILIHGPTASGKTELAIRLAVKLGGEVINADAMQIYEGLPILSAQPTQNEQKQYPHRLYGVLDPGLWFLSKPFSLSALVAKVREVLDAGAGAAN